MSNEILSTLLLVGSVLAPVALLGGIVMLWLGLRGRRVDDHPLCRSCGFDLVGIPGAGEFADEGVPDVLCPECGKEVSDPARIKEGNRKRRPRMMGIAVCLLAYAVLASAGLFTAMSRSGLTKAMPSWVLVIMADSPDATRQREALAELADRISQDRISPWIARAAIGRALAAQAKWVGPWIVERGDLIEAGWHAKLTTIPQYRQFLQNGVVLTCGVNPVLGPDEATWEVIDITPVIWGSIDRVGVGTSVELRVQLVEVRCGEERIAGDGNEGSMTTVGQGRPTVLSQMVEIPRKPVGQVNAQARYHIVIRGTERDDAGSADLAGIEVDMDFTYDVRPSQASPGADVGADEGPDVGAE
ncbi:MAG: hypothetical protein IT435_14915 [Phycisphaerales bacterium]|nr:hypothetical protein [Phycisphaerales bacterium]